MSLIEVIPRSIMMQIDRNKNQWLYTSDVMKMSLDVIHCLQL
jgi:hypothetical protein